MLSHSWKSRKVIIGLSLTLTVITIATVAMFLDMATFDQWLSAVQWIAGTVVMPTFLGMAHDNHLTTKAKLATPKEKCGGSCGS